MKANFTLHLRDRDPALVIAWQGYFKSIPTVTVSQGDIFDPALLPSDAIISPANSFGFMDGGIDLAYSQFFGWELQDRLRLVLRQEHDGELPVGQAIILPSEHSQISYLVSAPTMRVPMDIAGTTNVYLAFRAALRTIQQFNKTAAVPIQRVLSPGFGTGYGRMPAPRAALQMHEAFTSIILGDQNWAETAKGFIVIKDVCCGNAEGKQKASKAGTGPAHGEPMDTLVPGGRCRGRYRISAVCRRYYSAKPRLFSFSG